MELRNQKPVRLSVALIEELLENGYTRFQDERTWNDESIETFLLQNLPQFTAENVKDQITLMFQDDRLKGKRTQKVVRPVFTFAEDISEPEIPAEYLKEEIIEGEIPMTKEELERGDVPEDAELAFPETDEIEDAEVVEEEELAPWEVMG